MDMEMPSVSVREWIKVGNVDAVVLQVGPSRLQVGYYQNRSKAIGESAVWDGEGWKFEHDGPNGSYLRGEEESLVKRGPRG
jgi:hypothetical protein